jgi:hypothetical protein
MARHITATKFLHVTVAVIALASLHGNYDAMGQENPVRIVTGLLATSQSLGWEGLFGVSPLLYSPRCAILRSWDVLFVWNFTVRSTM